MTETILPNELPFALERAPQAKILSLDCFDTLLWRDTHAPAGVFTALENIQQGQRIVGEANARKLMRAARRKNEVTLEQIYAAACPNASTKEHADAVRAELEAEARCCFAFATTVALMRAARAKGLPVVIASDTYLNADQLGALIESAAGSEVRGLIDRIFCSSQLGVSKSEGMLAHVLKKMKCHSADVLHIGDNPKADYDAARALGIPALHLVQFAEETKQRLRLEAVMGAMTSDQSKPAPSGLQPHRAILSAGEPEIADPAQALGFSALGPIFHGFNAWLEDEAQQLAAARGGKVHWLFLMRDGHLPREVRAASMAGDPGHPIELSRYVAIASSLTSKAAIERHAGLELGLRPATLARQMLMSEAEIDEIAARDDQAEAAKDLHKELQNGARQKQIQRKARAFGKRMVQHIRSACDPQPGDTLMLVDLGYNGSAQNRVDAMLQEELGVHVAGRYLLLREMDAPALDKKGLIDATHFSAPLLEAMCANVAVLEQLSTTAMGSVVDYTEAGEPIRSAPSVKGAQSETRDRVQSGCIQFAAKAAEGLQIRQADHHQHQAWREAACAALARLMYLPLPSELEVVREFEHDVNLGSERMVKLFDPSEAAEGLRRCGLFYMKGSERMYLPAELAGEDISLRLSFFAQKAFGLSLTYADSAKAASDLPVVYLAGEEASQQTVPAFPTHDGYYTVRLPIGAARYSVALQLGRRLQWVEIKSIVAAPITSLTENAAGEEKPLKVATHFDDIEKRGPGIYECANMNSVLLVSPPEVSVDETREDFMVEVVFRPLVTRETDVANAASRLAQAAA